MNADEKELREKVMAALEPDRAEREARSGYFGELADAAIAAMRSGAPPQPTDVEALAEARGLEFGKVVAVLVSLRVPTGELDHWHVGIQGPDYSYSAVLPAASFLEPATIGAPKPEQVGLDLTREEVEALYVSQGAWESPGMLMSARSKLRAFLAGAPSEDDRLEAITETPPHYDLARDPSKD